MQSGDLIHADRHGAVFLPVESIDAMAAALDGLMKREASIIAAARAGRYSRDHQSGDERLIFDAADFRCHLSLAAGFLVDLHVGADYLSSAPHFFSTTRIVAASVKVFPVITL